MWVSTAVRPRSMVRMGPALSGPLRPRAGLQEQRGGSRWSSTFQPVQECLEEPFRADGACDRAPQRRTSDTQLPGHRTEDVVADLSTAGAMRDVCNSDGLSVVPANELAMMPRRILSEAQLARQGVSYLAGGERHPTDPGRGALGRPAPEAVPDGAGADGCGGRTDARRAPPGSPQPLPAGSLRLRTRRRGCLQR
jgi:hypothetical protein